MKRNRARPEKKTPGTVLGERMRAEANKLTDAERERLGDEFLKLYYGRESRATATHRR